MNPVLNKELIVEKLKEFNITDIEGAILYLLATYHEINPITTINIDTIQQVNLSKIVERDYELNKIKWNIDLYIQPEEVIEVEEAWKWVFDEYRPLFKAVLPVKAGDKRGTLKKMKDFFAANPHIRKEEVLRAAKYYTSNHIKDSSPKYLTQADHFISKKIDGAKNSKLEQYLEMIGESDKNTSNQSNRYTGKIK